MPDPTVDARVEEPSQDPGYYRRRRAIKTVIGVVSVSLGFLVAGYHLYWLETKADLSVVILVFAGALVTYGGVQVDGGTLRDWVAPVKDLLPFFGKRD